MTCYVDPAHLEKPEDALVCIKCGGYRWDTSSPIATSEGVMHYRCYLDDLQARGEYSGKLEANGHLAEGFVASESLHGGNGARRLHR